MPSEEKKKIREVFTFMAGKKLDAIWSYTFKQRKHGLDVFDLVTLHKAT